MLRRKKQMMKTIHFLTLVTFCHPALLKVMDQIFGYHLSLQMMTVFMLLNLMMILTLPWELLELTILMLSVVRNCLTLLRKRRVLAFGQWLKITLERISQKYVFLFTLMSLSLLCKNVLKIWNILISLIVHMSGEKGYVSKILMGFFWFFFSLSFFCYICLHITPSLALMLFKVLAQIMI